MKKIFSYKLKKNFKKQLIMGLSNRTILKIRTLLFVVGCAATTSILAKSIIFQRDPFATLKRNGYKSVRLLKGKKGELLGYIYVKENSKYTNHVLAELLVVKTNGSKLDTLYQINVNGDFVNSNGKIELKNPPDHKYYGFKLEKAKEGLDDLFYIGEIDKKGNLFSDDNDYLVNWDIKTKKFVYYPAP
jgi:hypothetical protein